MNKKQPSVIYLTQTTAPYRERMHELIAEKITDYEVIFCAKFEPDRLWKVEIGNYKHRFLTERVDTVLHKHNNPEIWKILNKENPDVLIITAFKPTMLYGALWCAMKGKKLIVYNDGTLISERDFSFVQKMIRRFVFSKTKAFVAPAEGGFDLYAAYGISRNRMFKSCLCIDNSRFTPKPMNERAFDIMFSGQIVERKMPMFFVEIAKTLKQKIPDLRVLIIGEGDMRMQMLEELDKLEINYHFAGYLDQQTLPTFYADAKLFLFPSLNDPWGVVANEACAAGTPVITCENAGVANDLIINGNNGYVLPLDADIWTEHTYELLTDVEKLNQFSENAVHKVESYNHREAANGILNSVVFAIR